MHHSLKSVVPVASKTLALAVAIGLATQAHADSFTYDGYLRQEMSWNMKNWDDTEGYNDKGKLSMMRSTARLNVEWSPSELFTLVAKMRAVKEVETNFLKELSKRNAHNYHGDDLMDLYDRSELRELFVDIPFGERYNLRFGKQQVVWGESDFFAANDLVHGFDNTWRSFLEPANEELRKANIIAKLNVDIPEYNGGLELFVRPGWDNRDSIGTEIDIYGGRWSSQPYAGVDFRNIDPYNFENDEGDYRDVTGGIRWSGLYGDTNYSLSYLKSFYPAPILNPASDLALLGMPGTSSGAETQGTDKVRGVAGEIIYPMVDIFGFTASRYIESADAVFSTEVAYIKDAPFNFEAQTPTLLSQNIAPGFDGWMTKDMVALMLRMDKTIPASQTLLGTEKPMFFSLQLFDKWIQNYDKDDQLLYSVGWGGKVKEHSVLATAIFDTSYANGRIRPGLVLGSDLSNGGGFAVPSVTFELTSKFKWKIEYDYFWNNEHHDKDKCVAGSLATCEDTTLFGYLHKRDQLYTSFTYLF